MSNPPLRFIALGDSYTIGESVDPSQAWPAQLVAGIRAEGLPIDNPIVIAETGWTTSDLLAAVNATDSQGSFGLVTLLIGVNNQYQGKDIESFREEFCTLQTRAVNFAGGDPTRVMVLSIPDWSVTPFAEGRDRAHIRSTIDQFNAVSQEMSLATGTHYLDITHISRRAIDDTSLLASDQLHPSGKMYAAWVALMAPVVNNILHLKG